MSEGSASLSIISHISQHPKLVETIFALIVSWAIFKTVMTRKTINPPYFGTLMINKEKKLVPCFSLATEDHICLFPIQSLTSKATAQFPFPDHMANEDLTSLPSFSSQCHNKISFWWKRVHASQLSKKQRWDLELSTNILVDPKISVLATLAIRLNLE